MNKTQEIKRELIKRDFFLIMFLIFFIIVVFGGELNSFVVSENNCRMPVKSNYIFKDDTHFSYIDKEDINFYLLADNIDIGVGIASIGDLIMFVGFILTLVSGIFFVYFNLKLNNIINYNE